MIYTLYKYEQLLQLGHLDLYINVNNKIGRYLK